MPMPPAPSSPSGARRGVAADDCRAVEVGDRRRRLLELVDVRVAVRVDRAVADELRPSPPFWMSSRAQPVAIGRGVHRDGVREHAARVMSIDVLRVRVLDRSSHADRLAVVGLRERVRAEQHVVEACRSRSFAAVARGEHDGRRDQRAGALLARPCRRREQDRGDVGPLALRRVRAADHRRGHRSRAGDRRRA